MKIIEIDNITYTYPEEKEAVLKNLSFEAEQGSCLFVMGDNGSGKTTFFKVLNGLIFPEKGRYLFDGKEITGSYLKDNKNSKMFHKRIGYLFQNPDIMLFNGKVYDEVAFGPRQMGMSEGEISKRTGDCMKLFGIEELSDKAPYHLSGGQKKMVAFAAVMALNPDVLILDEPFEGLDKKKREFIGGFLAELKSVGKTIIVSTHLEDETGQLADDIYRL